MTVVQRAGSEPTPPGVAGSGATELPNLPNVHPYRAWQDRQGVPRYTGYYLEDLAGVDLGEWPARGDRARGAFVNLEGTGGVNDLQVVEIAPGGTLEPVRHLFEALVYVVAGRGSTSVWADPQQKHSFEWGAGSLFAIPLNTAYQFFNASGSLPARLALVTNAPTVMNLFHNEAFIWDNPFVFADRFPGQSASAPYFSGSGQLYRRNRSHVWETNFVADVRSFPLHAWSERGGGGRSVLFEIAHNSMGAHISEFAVGTYKKAHRHGPGAHVVILDGMGYSTLWREGQAEAVKVEWKPNSVVVPPSNWFHQHFNTGPSPARYLALKYAGRRYFLSDAYYADKSDVSVKEGGLQMEYEDEDPAVHQLFESELTRNGAACHMRGLHPLCTGEPSTS